MFVSRIRAAALVMAAGMSLGACASYGGGGFSSVSFGIGSGGYYDPYYDDYYYGGSRYGRSYSPYYGWYNGFYYPGTGYYVYDQYRRPHRWNDYQRRYWEDRRRGYVGVSRGDRRELRDNWREFRQERRSDDRQFRQERREDRRAFRRGEVPVDQYRQDRRMDRREYRRDLRQDRRELRRENRRDRRD